MFRARMKITCVRIKVDGVHTVVVIIIVVVIIETITVIGLFIVRCPKNDIIVIIVDFQIIKCLFNNGRAGELAGHGMETRMVDCLGRRRIFDEWKICFQQFLGRLYRRDRRWHFFNVGQFRSRMDAQQLNATAIALIGMRIGFGGNQRQSTVDGDGRVLILMRRLSSHGGYR